MNGEGTVGLMRNLGQFVGHLAAGFRSDPRADRARAGERRRMHRSVDEQQRPDGVILRRTVIDEVELPARAGGAGHTPPRGDEHDHAS